MSAPDFLYEEDLISAERSSIWRPGEPTELFVCWNNPITAEDGIPELGNVGTVVIPVAGAPAFIDLYAGVVNYTSGVVSWEIPLTELFPNPTLTPISPTSVRLRISVDFTPGVFATRLLARLDGTPIGPGEGEAYLLRLTTTQTPTEVTHAYSCTIENIE